MDAKEFKQFADEYKNWGRWGPDDEAGTLNHVTPEHIVEACHLVRKGKVFALAIPFDRTGPQINPQGARFNPIHVMLRTGTDVEGMLTDDPPVFHSTDDMVSMPLQCATQWDALSHVIFKGEMYNGRPATMVNGQGAQANSIDKVRDRMVGRGVLLDVARHRGLEYLEPGDGIGPDELDACAARQGVTVRQGDFLLVRTGTVGKHRRRGDWDGFSSGPWPGIDYRCIPWLYEKQVAVVTADTVGVEMNPSGVDGVFLPVHLACLANMGTMLGEILDLEELGDDCARDEVYEFLFVAPPLPITKAVGSPINPYVIK